MNYISGLDGDKKVQVPIILDNELKFNSTIDYFKNIHELTNYYIKLIHEKKLPHLLYLSSTKLPNTNFTSSSAHKECAYKNASRIYAEYKNKGTTNLDLINFEISNIVLNDQLYDLVCHNTEHHNFSNLSEKNREIIKFDEEDKELHGFEFFLGLKMLHMQKNKQHLKKIKIPFHGHKFLYSYLYNPDYELQKYISFSKQNNFYYLNLYFKKNITLTSYDSTVELYNKCLNKNHNFWIKKEQTERDATILTLENQNRLRTGEIRDIRNVEKQVKAMYLKVNKEENQKNINKEKEKTKFKKFKKQCYNCQKEQMLLTQHEVEEKAKNLVNKRNQNEINQQIYEYKKNILIDENEIKNNRGLKNETIDEFRRGIIYYQKQIKNLEEINKVTSNFQTEDEIIKYLKTHILISENTYNKIIEFHEKQRTSFEPKECELNLLKCESLKKKIKELSVTKKEYKKWKEDQCKSELIEGSYDLKKCEAINVINNIENLYDDNINTVEGKRIINEYFTGKKIEYDDSSFKYYPSKIEIEIENHENKYIKELIHNEKRREFRDKILNLREELDNYKIDPIQRLALTKTMIDINYVNKDIENSILSRYKGLKPTSIQDIIENISWDGLSEIIVNVRGGSPKNAKLRKMILKAAHENGVLISTFRGYDKCKCGGDTFFYHNGLYVCKSCGCKKDMSLEAAFTIKNITGIAKYKRTIVLESMRKTLKRSVMSTINL